MKDGIVKEENLAVTFQFSETIFFVPGQDQPVN
jgi:hypothetical protein